MQRVKKMQFLRDIAGIAGSRFVMLLAIGAAVLLLTGEGGILNLSLFMMGNF